jgi:lipopolysaccharide/colanic/teichoic acid biosynthesis glycosyltransferase
MLVQSYHGDVVSADLPVVSAGRTIDRDFMANDCRREGYARIKPFVEWPIAMVLLVVFSPLMLVIAILIRVTSRGPIVYAQTRLGLHGRHYRIFKFRTMVHDAELISGPVWAAKQDRRVTPLGAVLRNTHLDELPQLWNVLIRDMNLIGPRPERPEMAAKIVRNVAGFNGRLAVRPGITGLAQMLVPADDPDDRHFDCARRKLAHDLYYVRRVNLTLDLMITFCTACHFTGSSIDCLRRWVMRAHESAVARMIVDAGEPSSEQVA